MSTTMSLSRLSCNFFKSAKKKLLNFLFNQGYNSEYQ